MTEEIKEILDLLKYCVEKNEYLEVANMKEWKPLLNYITNLQKENTDLKKLCDKYEEEHKTTFETWEKVIARNEKAVEFVKSMEYCGQEDYFYDLKSKDPCGNDNTFNDSKYKLLNILEGGDK